MKWPLRVMLLVLVVLVVSPSVVLAWGPWRRVAVLTVRPHDPTVTLGSFWNPASPSYFVAVRLDPGPQLTALPRRGPYAMSPSWEDPVPATNPVPCYLVGTSYDGMSSPYFSDLVCAVRGVASGLAPAVTFRTEDCSSTCASWYHTSEAHTVQLSWTEPTAPFTHALVVRLGPGEPSGTLIPIGTTSHSAPLAAPSCYLVVILHDGAAVGNSDFVCAVPTPRTSV